MSWEVELFYWVGFVTLLGILLPVIWFSFEYVYWRIQEFKYGRDRLNALIRKYYNKEFPEEEEGGK